MGPLSSSLNSFFIINILTVVSLSCHKDTERCNTWSGLFCILPSPSLLTLLVIVLSNIVYMVFKHIQEIFRIQVAPCGTDMSSESYA